MFAVQLRMGSRSLTELHSTLCNLYFIEKRCALDASAVYDLAAEYEVVLDLLRDNTVRSWNVSCLTASSTISNRIPIGCAG